MRIVASVYNHVRLLADNELEFWYSAVSCQHNLGAVQVGAGNLCAYVSLDYDYNAACHYAKYGDFGNVLHMRWCVQVFCGRAG